MPKLHTGVDPRADARAHCSRRNLKSRRRLATETALPRTFGSTITLSAYGCTGVFLRAGNADWRRGREDETPKPSRGVPASLLLEHPIIAADDRCDVAAAVAVDFDVRSTDREIDVAGANVDPVLVTLLIAQTLTVLHCGTVSHA